jgi:hypothetical protein
MTSFLIFLVSQSILIPFIAGLIRWRRITGSYQPFFTLIVVAVLTEAINGYLIKIQHHSNAIPSNIYALIECILIAWQFHVWGLLRTKKLLFYGLLLAFAGVWVYEDLILGNITGFPPYFRFLYSFLTVLLSVNTINFMITHDNRNLLRHPDFLICIGFIIFFIYKIIYEWAYQASLFGQSSITTNIIMSFGYINAGTNIIFAIAFLMIPARQKFTLY